MNVLGDFGDSVQERKVKRQAAQYYECVYDHEASRQEYYQRELKTDQPSAVRPLPCKVQSDHKDAHTKQGHKDSR